MDFSSLLHVAQKNEKTPKKEIKYYSTKFEPPKKEERTKQLSVNIKKFLARKEAEEKKVAVKAKEKKEELLALRSQDKKATRRVSVMLKRTKSANKSVIQDAVDNDNTAVTLTGPSQPDEDDYGYVSQEASAYYNKMMAKYSTMPDEPKFSSSKKNTNINLNGTKDRVRAALLKEQEDALLPHRRKRKLKHEETDDDKDVQDKGSYSPDTAYSENIQEKPSKPKPKFNAPPPLNFRELLKLAEKKQFEPIKIEPKKKSEGDENPMTKRQRREYEKERAWLEQRERRREAMENENFTRTENDKTSMPPPNKIPKLNSSSNIVRIPKLASSSSEDRLKNSDKRPLTNIKKSILDRKSETNNKLDINKSSKLRSELEKPRELIKTKSQCSLQVNNKNRNMNTRKISENLSKEMSKNIEAKEINRNSEAKKMLKQDINSKETNKSKIPLPNSAKSKVAEAKNKPAEGRSKQLPPSDVRSKQYLPGDTRYKPLPSSEVRPKQFTPSDVHPKQFPPSDVRSKQLSLFDVRPKQFPPTDVRHKQISQSNISRKQFPLSDVRSKQFPPSDVRPKQVPQSDVRSKQIPSANIRPKQFPPEDVRRKPLKKPPMGHKRRILDDDDSEYDSEMDDFIDDGPDENQDYSKYISEIFGYDKSRYRDIPEDDDRMESSFSQMMREEFISSKIGLMEDLEDMKQEAIEKKQKAARKKR